MKTFRFKKWVKVLVIFIPFEALMTTMVLTGGSIGVICLILAMATLMKGIDWVYEK